METFMVMNAQLRISINVYVGTYSFIGGPFCGVAKVYAPYWVDMKLKMSD